MTPYGGDRVRVDGETILLSCRVPKGWRARVERALNQSEFPGTAVMWDDEFYEVIRIEPLPAGVRYTLEPWRDHHAMRVSERYDAESEAHRVAERRSATVRERKRKSVNFLALFTGHLPAIVQERLASETGVLAARLTFISLFSTWAVMLVMAWLIANRVMAERPMPNWAIVIGGYLLLESALRFLLNMTQSRPVGSTVGVVAYILYWLLTGARRETTPFEALPGHGVTIPATPDDRKLADSMTMREPLATLLPIEDQNRLQQRHGYDYRRSAYGVAAILLIFSTLGIVTSVINGAMISLVVAIAVAGEQIVRLAAFSRGPAASVIGWLVRPLLRDLL